MIAPQHDPRRRLEQSVSGLEEFPLPNVPAFKVTICEITQMNDYVEHQIGCAVLENRCRMGNLFKLPGRTMSARLLGDPCIYARLLIWFVSATPGIADRYNVVNRVVCVFELREMKIA